jgi:hypothetical protein
MRDGLKDFLSIMRKEFTCYIATAANREHAYLFLDAFDACDRDAEHSKYFKGKGENKNLRLKTVQAGSKTLKNTSGARYVAKATLSPDDPRFLAPGTSTFSSIIVDDCRQAKGISFIDNENTWSEVDRNNVWQIEPFNPMVNAVNIAPCSTRARGPA